MDKAEGVTSFRSLSGIKKEHRGEKVGHAGTLDRFASGLMVILIGGATRLNPAFSSFDKEYIARIRFGEETDTLDPEGEVIARAPVPSEEDVAAVLPRFRGEQEQIPPVYSALHVGGRRAYEEARRGRSIEMAPRRIAISSIEMLSFTGREAVIRASVSKGTYIRSLARDIARAAGSCAHLSGLRRLRIGPWRLEDIGKGTDELLQATGLFSVIVLSEGERKRIENGTIRPSAILSDTDPSLPYAFLSFPSGPYGIGEKRDGRLRVVARTG